MRRMMKLIVRIFPSLSILNIIIFFPTFGYSDVKHKFADKITPFPYFKQLCITEARNGLDWRNGTWIHTRFTKAQYIVRKERFPKSFKEAYDKRLTSCWPQKTKRYGMKPTMSDESFNSHEHVCVSIIRIGEKSLYKDSYICHEIHSGIIGSEKYPDREEHNIQCWDDGFGFEPNGWFHRSIINYNFIRNPKDNYKDSMLIEVGKCTDITE